MAHHKDKHRRSAQDAPTAGGPEQPPSSSQDAEADAPAPAPQPTTQTPPAPQPEGAEAAAEAPAPKTPQEELAELRAQSDDLLKRLQRVSADYLNYQKRARRESDHHREYANEAIIKAMLPVLDDIDRALEAGAPTHGADDPLLVGLKLVRDKALAVLAQFGLAPIESQGKPFDPDHHSAVTRQPTADCPPGTVLKELARGYALKGRTIRPAMVVVSAAPEK